MNEKIECVIFDFDGTLVDSEPNYYLADKILLERHDLKIDPEFKKQYVGIGAYEMMDDIRKKHGLEISTAELVREKNEIYLDIALNNTNTYPEVERFARYLKDSGYKTAVASGSSREILETILGHIGFDSFFDAVVSSDEVARGKPEPDVFLEAARRVGAEPSRCLVLEDSLYGVIAAVKAGMKCCAVPYVKENIPDVVLNADLFYRDKFDFEKTVQWLEA